MKLQFDPDKHIYTLNGIIIPSVTTILKPLSDYDGIPQEVLDYAAARGTAVHRACEIFNNGEEFAAPLDSVIEPYFSAWRKFFQEHNMKITASEQRLHHPTFKYAGSFDALADINGEEWLLDIKCTSKLMPSVGPQLAAYQELLGRKVRRAAVQLKKDGTYSFQEYKNKSDLPVFFACLTIHNFKENHHAK